MPRARYLGAAAAPQSDAEVWLILGVSLSKCPSRLTRPGGVPDFEQSADSGEEGLDDRGELVRAFERDFVSAVDERQPRAADLGHDRVL